MDLDPDIDIAYLDNFEIDDSQDYKGGELLSTVNDFFVSLSFSNKKSCLSVEDYFSHSINEPNLGEISKEGSTLLQSECDIVSNSGSVDSISVCSITNDSNTTSKYDLRKRKYKPQNSSHLFSKFIDLEEKLSV